MLLCLCHSYPSNFSLREGITNGKFDLYFWKDCFLCCFFFLSISYIGWMMKICALPQVVGELANSELTALTILSLAGDCNFWRPLLSWLSDTAVIVWSLQLKVSNDLAWLRCRRPQCLQIPLHSFKCTSSLQLRCYVHTIGQCVTHLKRSAGQFPQMITDKVFYNSCTNDTTGNFCKRRMTKQSPVYTISNRTIWKEDQLPHCICDYRLTMSFLLWYLTPGSLLFTTAMVAELWEMVCMPRGKTQRSKSVSQTQSWPRSRRIWSASSR